MLKSFSVYLRHVAFSQSQEQAQNSGQPFAAMQYQYFIARDGLTEKM
ncbi:hypothetical protein [Chromobacterium sphagni]|nr:hypothetical protein [Chromobacterium sphagni]